MKEIILKNGEITQVDDDDFEELSKFKWRLICNYNYGGYVGFGKRKGRYGKYTTTLMHRIIMKPPQKLEIDHIDNNPLNNQRFNLRICTHAENLANQKFSKANTSGYRGVSKFYGKWMSSVRINGRQKNLGLFASKEEAANAYNQAAKKSYKKFAKLNKIKPK